jgi:nucleoside-diphosphate-sugar epimerase
MESMWATESLGRSADCVVVTGAAGFIGSHLVEALLAQGNQVLGIDDFDRWYDPEAKRLNLIHAMSNPRFGLIELDLVDNRQLDRLIDVLGRARTVFHLAGRPGVQDSWGTGFADHVNRNVLLTQQVYEASLAAGVERVVYASSSSVYGNSVDGSGQRQTAPVSPYGVAKLAGEHLAEVYRARGLSVTSLRFFTVYGPRQRPDMAMHRLFRATESNGSTFVLRGDGTQRREFTHVWDVVAATVAAGSRPEAADATIDVGGGCSVALRQVIQRVEAITERPVRLQVVPPSAGDPSSTAADHDQARRLLGWSPRIGLDVGLRSQAEWHRQAAGCRATIERPPANRPQPAGPPSRW